MIMAGGSGTRFWPKSRIQKPKQVQKIVSEDFTMIQTAYQLLKDKVPNKNIHVVTNTIQAPEIKNQLPELPPENIIEEPCGRDTAPCVGLAAAILSVKDPEGIMLMMPSDHIIKPKENFHLALQTAAKIVEEEKTLVTFGIPPTYPATGYGYIEQGSKVNNDSELSVFDVIKFTEKPDHDTALKFLETQQYFWNAGIFVWKAKYILELIEEFMPELFAGLQTLIENDFKNLNEVYPTLPKVSIDFGIMENAPKVKVVSVDYEWDDVGNWESIVNHFPKDDHNNLNLGTVIHQDSKNCIAIADNKDQLIATIGLDDLIIVQSGNAVLVANRKDGQKIKNLVDELKAQNLTDYL